MSATLGLALLAGLLTTLSPCVLPLTPIVLASAASEHRLGPVALAAGLALSFAAIGLFVASIGFALGLDGKILRAVGALVLIALGLVLAIPPLQALAARGLAPASGWAEGRFGSVSATGLGGQFAVGLHLGADWSPCVGPTLGAASLVAARSRPASAPSLSRSACSS